MASVSKDAKGWRIDFRLADGKRGVIRAGASGGKRYADEIASKLRELIAARAAGAVPGPSVAAWLGRLEDGRLRERLVELGLAPKRERDRPIVEWLETFLERHGERARVKPSTRKVWGRAVTHARVYFGGRLLSTLTEDDGAEFRAWLLSRPGRVAEGLAEATVRKSCGVLSMACRAARKAGAISCDPFEGVPKSACANPAREVYVDHAKVRRVMAAGPSEEFRLLVALSRFAGLRVPSEVRTLRWGAVDWAERALRVDSPKTERHGKPWRLVPIAPELLELLERAYAEAPEGEEFILPGYREHASPSMLILRACRGAGVEPWPRPFHALRASCETDWAARFPLADVSAWLGHSAKVAARHYLRPTEATFASATRTSIGGDSGGDAGGDKVRETVVAPVVTRSAESSRIESQERPEAPENKGIARKKRSVPRHFAIAREWRGTRGVDLIGLEPSAASPEKQAESAIDPSAVVTPVVTFETDCPDLAALGELWERLPPAMRGAVRAMAEAAVRSTSSMPPT
jgi:integrase